MSEQILVVERERLFAEGAFQGYRSFQGHESLLEAIAGGHHFTARGPAEENPALKQIIPYVLVRHGDAFLLYQRLKGGGEKRLHGNLSLGIGGHINPVDFEPSWRQEAVEIDFTPFLDQCEAVSGAGLVMNILENSVQREVSEEVSTTASGQARILGFLNDDSNAVGEVHFGLVFELAISAPEVTIREVESLELVGWLTAGELAERKEGMETWSALALGGIGAGTPS